MAELIPEAVHSSENDSTTVEVTSVKVENIDAFDFYLYELNNTADDYANWVHFGVGGPA